MACVTDKVLGDALKAYGAGAAGVRVEPLGAGNINDTYLVQSSGQRIILQRINSAVFPIPERVVDNFAKVSRHITAVGQAYPEPFLCAKPVLTANGDLSYRDTEGGVWRAQSWIDHIPAHRVAVTHKTAVQLGRTLARFHELTGDLPATSFAEPIPQFHCTPWYLDQFDGARTAWKAKPTPELEQALALVERFRSAATLLEEAAAHGSLARRIIHGDPKLDNVIFTDQGIAAGFFDLDTTGPGLLHYDIGDCLRSCCNRVGEDGAKRLEVRFDVDICRAVLGGYLEYSGSDFGDVDRCYIYDAVLVITVELALRFLTDYLRGNVYFKVKSAEENLLRALGQFQLAESICNEEEKIRACAVLGS